MDDLLENSLDFASEASSSTMATTLLNRVKLRDDEAWSHVYTLFHPVVAGWTKRSGLQYVDQMEVVQRVFTTMNRRIDRFERNQSGQSFRGWLWTITKFQILDYYREQQATGKPIGGSTNLHKWSLLDDSFQEDHSEEGSGELTGVLQRCIALVQDRVEATTWTAFWKATIECRPVSELAESLNVSKWTIYKAKSRVLKLLRTELDGMVDLDLLLKTSHHDSERDKRSVHEMPKPR